MLIKRKRSIILLLVFIFTVSLVFSQLWMLMTRYDIEDVFHSSDSNNIEDVDASSRHLKIAKNILATASKDHQFVDAVNEDFFRRRDDREYVTDTKMSEKFNDEKNGAPHDFSFDDIILERITTISRRISIDSIEELRTGNSSQTEKIQNDKRNSVDDSNVLIVPKIHPTRKPISDEYRYESKVINLNRSSENLMERMYTSTTSAVNIDTRDDWDKNRNLLIKDKNLKTVFTQKPGFNKAIHLNNTLEHQELFWPTKKSNDSENILNLNVSRDDFAADDLGIRGDGSQIQKSIESTTRNYPSFNFARVKNYGHIAHNFAEDNFDAVSNFEPLVPLPTKSVPVSESDGDTDSRKETNDVPSSQINVPNSPGINVVSMSLYGSDARYTVGALRNAEMIRRNFPGWTLRVYTESAASSPRHGLVPANIIQSLRRLGAEIQYVMPEQDFIPPMMWRFLVADDLSVDRFIVRDTDSRLTARDAAAVAAWIRSDKPFHSIRDHPSHAAYAVSGGLWGGKTAELRDILRRSWIDVMRGLAGDYFRDMSFLNDIVWPRVKQHAYCSDSVSCDRWPNSFPFPVRRRGAEHVGQVYDERDVGREGDVRILRAAGEYVRCLPNMW